MSVPTPVSQGHTRRAVLTWLIAAGAVAATGPQALAATTSHPFGTGAFTGVSGPEAVVYKRVLAKRLHLQVWRPTAGGNGRDAAGREGGARAALVLYHGGGWLLGKWEQLQEQAEYFAARGMVTISVEYRTSGPVNATQDAVDAMGYVVEHASALGIHPDRIVAAGGSAGGQLALATALLDRQVGAHPHLPAALVLWNPVTDTTRGAVRALFLTGKQARAHSPLHHLGRNAPPMLLMHGTGDTTVAFEDSLRFTNAARSFGNDATLISYDGQQHGFYNYQDTYNRYYYETMRQVDGFLHARGLLHGPQHVRPSPAPLTANGGFERGTQHWNARPGSRLAPVGRPVHSGDRALSLTSATGPVGAAQDITRALLGGGPGEYLFGAWLRAMDGVVTRPTVTVEVKGSGTREPVRFPLPVTDIRTDRYTLLSGTRRLTWAGELERATLLIEAPSPAALLVDDVSLEFLPARIGWWRFHTRSDDGVAVDSSGFGRDGSIHGAVWSADGTDGGCLDFDGAGGVDLPAPFDPNTTDFSVSCRLRPGLSGTDERRQVILHQTDGAPWLFLTPASRCLSTGLSRTELCNPRPLRPHQWTEVRLVRRGNQLSLSVDGQVSTIATDHLDSAEGTLSLGRPAGRREAAIPAQAVRHTGWTGQIDELSIHDFATQG
ncbi:alpha/beta hydrolase fold domain-containing protein [Streptomyces sp. NPDC090052]|uniref:alpha/beta hydrolase fold domain-containing protein n=1 Tax=Streptomyces sp. NPDC090052 TaxID=3365931 RepID=UPI003816A88C